MIVQFTTPVLARLARAWGLIDRPGARKIHASPVPRIGGVAIVLGALALCIPVLAMDDALGQALHGVRFQVIALLGAAFFMFLVGLLDDVRSIPARFKLLALVAASLVVCSTGARIESVTLESAFTIDLGWLSWPLTVFWIAAITVAMNFIDGLDGLAAGIATIVCGVIAIFAFSSGQLVMGVLMLSLVGSLTGFLFFNWNPAKIFMGDCGSMFLGFMIGAGSVVCQAKTATLVGIALPALALGVPLFDTLFTLFRRRILDRRSIFSAERGHIHHRLLDLGLHQRYAVVVMYAVTLAATGIGMLMFVTRATGTVAVIACVILLILLVFRVVGASRIRETIAAFHRNSVMARQAKEDREHFEDVQLQMQRAQSFEDWWQALCAMAARMQFDRLALVCRDNAASATMYSWRRTEDELLPENVVSVIMPLGDDGAVGASRIELAVRAAEPLETIGRRVTLFGRLIDEHNAGVKVQRAGQKGWSITRQVWARDLDPASRPEIRRASPSPKTRAS